MSVKVSSALAGAEQLIRAVKLADPRTRARVAAAIKQNAQAIAVNATARAPKKTGEMASTIRVEIPESANGLVAFVRVGQGKLPRRSKAATAKGIARAKGRKRKVGKGAYAPVVERGDPRRGHKPHPFLIPAYQQDVPKAKEDIKHALDSGVASIK